MKRIILLLLLSMVPTIQLLAQATQTDSAVLKTKLAVSDARRFKPTKQIRKAYRQHVLSNTSDYFNPTIQKVSKSDFLKDSAYVKAFKNAAYDNSVRSIKLNRTIIITCSIFIAGLVALAILVVKALDSFFSSLSNSIF